MLCSNCGSDKANVTLEQVKAKVGTKDPGALWKIGRFFLVIFTLGFWLIIGKRAATSSIEYTYKPMAVCQNCGHHWAVVVEKREFAAVPCAAVNKVENNEAQRITAAPQPFGAASAAVEFPQLLNYNCKEYEKQNEFFGVGIVGGNWAGNKENAEAVRVGDHLFFEKREPSAHGSNGVAVITESGNTVGFLPKSVQTEVITLMDAKLLFLVRADNSPVSNISIGCYIAPADLEMKIKAVVELPKTAAGRNAKLHDEAKYENLLIKVAGVTFNNDDGKSRQNILRKLKSELEADKHPDKIELRKTKYNGNDAIAVFVDGAQVGNIPAESVSYLIENWGRIHDVPRIEVYGGGFSFGNDEETNYGAKITVRLLRGKE